MPRRSSRLKGKKRVSLNEDSLFYRALGFGKDKWNDLVETVADDPAPQTKPWQRKSWFQPKPKALKKKKSKPVLRRSRIEVDESEVDFTHEDMESAQARVQRIEDADEKRQTVEPKASNIKTSDRISKKRKHLLFMNPGDVPIQTASLAIRQGSPLPAWATPFRFQLGIKGGRLTWFENNDTLPFALKDEKRAAVKKLYFDPRQPATIRPIASVLYKKWANINRKNVRNILQSLETYQLNIKNRMFLKGPGMIAMDMFFPSANLGWEKTNVLCCMDTWSRYCGVYVMDTKEYANVLEGMRDFLRKFAAFGHMPRRILSDKGSDMAAAAESIEQYRQFRDGDRPMVLHTATGTPVLIVEALNAQVQRRMQVFRTSELIDSAGQIAHEIADQINNQPRRDRGGLTPIQLLQLDAAGRSSVNELYRDRTVSHEVPGLQPLNVNDTVRLLKMTRKEQETNAIKGFAPKWSKRLYQVLRKTKLRKNEFVYRYDIGLPDTYYRHELQKIRGGRVDSAVPNQYVRYKEVVIGGYRPEDDEDVWEP